MHERLLSDSGKLSMALNKLHGCGTTISMLFYFLLGSHSHQPISTSILAAMVFWYFCTSTISPCHIWWPPPKLQSRSRQNCQGNTRSQTSAQHTNSLASRYTAMVPGSVSVRKPISHRFSDNLALNTLTLS